MKEKEQKKARLLPFNREARKTMAADIEDPVEKVVTQVASIYSQAELDAIKRELDNMEDDGA